MVAISNDDNGATGMGDIIDGVAGVAAAGDTFSVHRLEQEAGAR